MMLMMIIMKTICRSANQNTAVQGLIGSTNAYIGLSDTATEVDTFMMVVMLMVMMTNAYIGYLRHCH